MENNNEKKQEVSKTKKKEKKPKNRFSVGVGSIVVMLITLAVEALFTVMLMTLNILPFMYLAILIAVLVLVDLGLFFMVRKSRKESSKRLAATIIMVLVAIVMIMGCFYMLNTFDTFKKISSDGRQLEKFHVVVLADSKYEAIEDIEGQEVYALDTQSKTYAEAKERLLTKVEVKYMTAANVTAAGHQLIDKDGKTHDKIILVSDSNYEMLCENNKGFRKNTKFLYTISVASKTNDFAKRIDVTEDPFNIYISGVDTRGSIEDVCRSDVNMIVTVNPETRQVLLTSMPRDSYVELASVGMMDKLTHTGIYGIEETIATVENWLDVEINYYYRVNFKMLVDLIDALGGVTVDIPKGFESTYWDYSFKTGENQLDGKAALAFVRERKTFEDEDEERIKNQQRVMKAILKKATNSKVILTNYTDLLNAVEGSMQTNMSNKDITAIVKMQLKDMDTGWTIKSIAVDGKDAELGTYSMGPGKPLFVSVPKEKSVEEVKKRIHEVMYPVE